MKAAVITSFDEPPHFGDFPLPTAAGPHEVTVDVVAAGLHPRVRSQARGSHYTGAGRLPLVPGIDGVGRTADGTLRYFILPDTSLGSMAEHTVIDLRRSIALAEGTDPIQIAAAMNPAMSSWVALRKRIDFQTGMNVLVLGAGGNAGRLAIQVARTLGAGEVTAVGRGMERFPGLGADAVVELTRDPHTVAGELGDAGKDVDVVLDYLWGQPTHDALCAIIPRRSNDLQPLSWVQLGSVAGTESAIPSAALRAARLQILGSGQGSVSTSDIVAELADLARAVDSNAFGIDASLLPLKDIEAAWVESAKSRNRIVVTP